MNTALDLFPDTRPEALVQQIGGRAKTTTRRVAAMFGKRHDNVLRAVQRLLPDLPEGFAGLNFEASEYTDDTGRRLPEYLLTQDGFLMLAMGFTGREAARWRAAFIKAFNTMARVIERQQRAMLSAERERARAEVARAHSAIVAVLVATRAEQGKATEPHHIANECRLLGYALTGAPVGIDRTTLDADQLRLLHRVETQAIVLLVRGADYLTRKAELRALVLAALPALQAQSLDAADATEPPPAA